MAIFTANAPYKFRVLDAWIENTAANGANANTIQVCAAAAGSTPITDAMSLNGKVANDVGRAVAIQTANATVLAGGTINLRQTKAGGTMGGNVRILCVRTP